MGARTEELKYSEDEDESAHVTLAQALEEAHNAREATLALKNETLEELERFRQAMRVEVKERKRKFDVQDMLMLVGLSILCGGVAVAFHWAYSLIIAGALFMGIALLPLVRRAPEP